MEEMIGYCGYNCHLCAARSDDIELRQRMVEGWKRIFELDMYTAINVRCDGCKNDGRLADKQCKARPCAIEKKLEFCAECDEFPCDKVKSLMGSREGMLIYHLPETSSVTEGEYNLCMRQFDSMPNIIKILVKAGKLPSWIVEISIPSKD